jgi:hypothetical protein
MATVERLITTADVDDRSPDQPYVSVRARHEAVLADGRRLLLLDDRGWASNQPWAALSPDDVEETARMVVGPDEPPPGRSREEEEAGHWSHLAGTLQRHRVAVDARALRNLPHDVVLSERLLARIGRGPGSGRRPVLPVVE